MQLQFSAGVIVYRHIEDPRFAKGYAGHGAREYLLLQAAVYYWGFAKGKIEKGESKREAALRELKEETGLDATIHEGFEYTLGYFFKDRSGLPIKKTVYFFVGQAQPGEVALSHEHKNFIWLPFQDALCQVTYANDREALILADKFLHEMTLK